MLKPVSTKHLDETALSISNYSDPKTWSYTFSAFPINFNKIFET